MQLKLATWNINSIRLRFDQVARFCDAPGIDVLCLQETKCPDDRFPLSDLNALGFVHVAFAGQKGYNGVAIASRLPFQSSSTREFCGRADARHISVQLGKEAGETTISNLYIPAGGDIPDPDANPKFGHKLAFLDEFATWSENQRSSGGRHVVVGDFNVAPLEHDVWNHKRMLDIVSHTPIETGKLGMALDAGDWVDAIRTLRPSPEKIYSWWSYRSPDWAAADKGRRLDHIWLSKQLAPHLTTSGIFRDTRGWARPSDHVPVITTLTF